MHFQRHKFLIDAHYICTVYNVELVNKLFQSSYSPSAKCFLGNTLQFISLPTTSSVDEDTTVGTTLITVKQRTRTCPTNWRIHWRQRNLLRRLSTLTRFQVISELVFSYWARLSKFLKKNCGTLLFTFCIIYI